MAKNFDKNSLEYDVISYILDNWSNYDNKLSIFTDVLYHGCVSGIVGHLIYYADTVKYYEDHQQQINELLYNSLQECGISNPAELFGDKWDEEDPLALDTYNWWIKTVKPHIDTNKEKEKIWKRETAKERRILDYLQNQLEEGIITLQDVKSPIYREYLLEASLPF